MSYAVHRLSERHDIYQNVLAFLLGLQGFFYLENGPLAQNEAPFKRLTLPTSTSLTTPRCIWSGPILNFGARVDLPWDQLIESAT